MINNYGELYLDHYYKYFGDWTRLSTVEDLGTGNKMQLINYERVFESCVLVNTLGISKYKEITGENVEVTLVSDKDFEGTVRMFGEIMMFAVERGLRLVRGTAISGVGNLDRNFEDKYNKSALYITDHFGLPEGYWNVGEQGKMVLAILISQEEYEYVVSEGPEKFESRLEESGGDPFEIGRKSSV